MRGGEFRVFPFCHLACSPIRSVFVEDVKSGGEPLKDRVWQGEWEQDAVVEDTVSHGPLPLDSKVGLGDERSRFVQGRPWVPSLVCPESPVGWISFILSTGFLNILELCSGFSCNFQAGVMSRHI